MIYTEEQWKVIREAGPHFRTAKRDYIRNAPRLLTEQVIKAYEDATGKTIANKSLGCAVCVLRVYQTVAETYFRDLEERERIEAEKQNEKNNAESDNGKQEEKPDKGDKKKGKRGNRQNKEVLAEG